MKKFALALASMLLVLSAAGAVAAVPSKTTTDVTREMCIRDSHPIFTLNDGVSHIVKKVRGEKAVVSGMAATMAERMAQGTPYYIGISDRKYEDEYVEACTKKVGYAPAGIFRLG